MQNKLVLKTILMKVIIMVISLLPSQSRTKILGFNHKLSFNFTSFQKYVLMEVLGFGWVVYGFFPNKMPLQIFFYQVFHQYETVKASTKTAHNVFEKGFLNSI